MTDLNLGQNSENFLGFYFFEFCPWFNLSQVAPFPTIVTESDKLLWRVVLTRLNIDFFSVWDAMTTRQKLSSCPTLYSEGDKYKKKEISVVLLNRYVLTVATLNKQ